MDELVTLAAVLEWLSPRIVADFDCPNHGPHHWLPRVTSRSNSYVFCRNCNRLKREVDPEWLAMRKIYGIYA